MLTALFLLSAMRVSRFFVESELYPGETVELPRDTSHYIYNVLRMKTGAELILFDGRGSEYESVIETINGKFVKVKISSRRDRDVESPLSAHLALSLSKGERFEYALQKAVELGVSEITPLFTDRCEVKINQARLEKKYKHWQKIIVSACEQCGRSVVPKLYPADQLGAFIRNASGEKKIVLHPQGSARLENMPRLNSVVLLVGPEGGFSDIELKEISASGFEAVSLGKRVMRAETAPVAALAVLQYMWGDFSS